MKGFGILLLSLCLPLLVVAEEQQQPRKNFIERLDEQIQINASGMMGGDLASGFNGKRFDTAVFNTKVLNEKSSNLFKESNNFNFPNNSFSKQFNTGTYQGFSKDFNTSQNTSFNSDKSYDPGGRPFNGKTLDYNTNRDSEKQFSSQDWNKTYYASEKQYKGKEMTTLGEYTGTVVLKNKEDMNWGQDTLSSQDIKKILNKN